MDYVWRSVVAVFGVAVLATPVWAHGWVVPPYIAAGTGVAVFTGPVGVGDGPAEPPAAPGGTPASPGTSAPAPRVRTTSTPSRPGAASAAFGRTTPTARPKGMTEPWRALITIPWIAAFPVPNGNGYAGRPELDRGLTTPGQAGGWVRDESRPSFVLVYDPANRQHEDTVAKLEADRRFQGAAPLFNCFRADASLFGASTGEVRLRAYDRIGNLVGEVQGDRRIRGAFDLLERAWNGPGATPLVGLLPRAVAAQEACAQTEHKIQACEHAVICPDCGEHRSDVQDVLRVLRRQLAEHRASLAELH